MSPALGACGAEVLGGELHGSRDERGVQRGRQWGGGMHRLNSLQSGIGGCRVFNQQNDNLRPIDSVGAVPEPAGADV